MTISEYPRSAPILESTLRKALVRPPLNVWDCRTAVHLKPRELFPSKASINIISGELLNTSDKTLVQSGQRLIHLFDPNRVFDGTINGLYSLITRVAASWRFYIIQNFFYSLLRDLGVCPTLLRLGIMSGPTSKEHLALELSPKEVRATTGFFIETEFVEDEEPVGPDQWTSLYKDALCRIRRMHQSGVYYGGLRRADIRFHKNQVYFINFEYARTCVFNRSSRNMSIISPFDRNIIWGIKGTVAGGIQLDMEDLISIFLEYVANIDEVRKEVLGMSDMEYIQEIEKGLQDQASERLIAKRLKRIFRRKKSFEDLDFDTDEHSLST